MKISGCEVSFVKAMKDTDRHAANRGLEAFTSDCVSLDTYPASRAIRLSRVKDENKHVRKLLKALGITEEITDEEIENA